MDPARRLPPRLHDGPDDDLALCAACGCSVCLTQAGIDGSARSQADRAPGRRTACLPAVRRNRYPFAPP